VSRARAVRAVAKSLGRAMKKKKVPKMSKKKHTRVAQNADLERTLGRKGAKRVQAKTLFRDFTMGYVSPTPHKMYNRAVSRGQRLQGRGLHPTLTTTTKAGTKMPAKLRRSKDMYSGDDLRNTVGMSAYNKAKALGRKAPKRRKRRS